jgi:hypothetical protein
LESDEELLLHAASASAAAARPASAALRSQGERVGWGWFGIDVVLPDRVLREMEPAPRPVRPGIIPFSAPWSCDESGN